VAVIHKTTMSPGKLELLTAWLPAQQWHAAAGDKPELPKAGGSGWMIQRGRSGSSSWP
jgi:hypothetical protein